MFPVFILLATWDRCSNGSKYHSLFCALTSCFAVCLSFLLREVIEKTNHRLIKEEHVFMLQCWWRHKKTDVVVADSEEKFSDVQLPTHKKFKI